MEDLLVRLDTQPGKEVAIGGILGARYQMPGINMLGTHRLDLTVHNWSGERVEKLLRKLDPGLKKVDQGQIPQVVVHNLHRKDSFFIQTNTNTFADEVECLMDLDEARLESQALELLDHLKKQRNP